MKKITFIVILILIIVLSINKAVPERNFVLTERNGVVFTKSIIYPYSGEKQTYNSREYVEDKSGKYRLYSNKKIGLSFLHPKDLIQAETTLSGFEEYFTLPQIITSEIFSYPGKLSNPETTEPYYTFSIRLIVFKGNLRNTETWFEQFQNRGNMEKKALNINGTLFTQYQKAFGQNYNTVTFSSHKNQILMLAFLAKAKTDYKIGEEMMNVILATLKWI
jgi:hypothetical protein